MKKKTSNKKRAYLDDFILNEAGKYEYKGTIYKIVSEFDKNYLIRRIVLLTVCLVGAGFVPFSGSMHAFYIITPYMVEIVVLALLVYAYIQFIGSKGEIREYIFKKSVERFKPYSSLIIGNIGLTFISTMIYSFINGFELWAIAYVSLHVIAFISIRQFYAYVSTIKCDKISLKQEM